MVFINSSLHHGLKNKCIYLHGALYKANSVMTHQHLKILTKQIMQDYCRGKQKDNDIINPNMKASNSDKLGHFKMVKTVQYTTIQTEYLFLSPLPSPDFKAMVPRKVRTESVI